MEFTMEGILNCLGLLHDYDEIHCNLSNVQLIERSISTKKGHLTDQAALVVDTGKHTGRAAMDKYVVDSESIRDKVNWEGPVNKMPKEQFDDIKRYMITRLNSSKKSIYLATRSAGHHEEYNIKVNFLTTSPTHNLFFNHMFRDDHFIRPLDEYTILHTPSYFLDKKRFKTRSSTVVAINFEEKLILITGTAYSGEIKKSIFSILSFLLPDYDVLPMHAGANIDSNHNVSLFFGLSGTGKTTLSSDEGKLLIGDDEHGLCPQGVFNFEGGCYAKTLNLSKEKEPDIFKACESFGTLLENVVTNRRTRTPNFYNNAITENGRASYPLSAPSLGLQVNEP
jgi:phosphoenolpyruvate carboxykinase (ATP)